MCLYLYIFKTTTGKDVTFQFVVHLKFSNSALHPQLTPADGSSLSDYSSEPALYF